MRRAASASKLRLPLGPGRSARFLAWAVNTWMPMLGLTAEVTAGKEDFELHATDEQEFSLRQPSS